MSFLALAGESKESLRGSDIRVSSGRYIIEQYTHRGLLSTLWRASNKMTWTSTGCIMHVDFRHESLVETRTREGRRPSSPQRDVVHPNSADRLTATLAQRRGDGTPRRSERICIQPLVSGERTSEKPGSANERNSPTQANVYNPRGTLHGSSCPRAHPTWVHPALRPQGPSTSPSLVNFKLVERAARRRGRNHPRAHTCSPNAGKTAHHPCSPGLPLPGSARPSTQTSTLAEARARGKIEFAAIAKEADSDDKRDAGASLL